MYGHKTDDNQAEIVDALRKVGCSVAVTSAMGKGFPDLVVATPAGRTLLMEVKDGKKPPSARALTADQVKFHDAWKGELWVVLSVNDALQIIGITN